MLANITVRESSSSVASRSKPWLPKTCLSGLIALVLATTGSLHHARAANSITAGSLTSPFPTYEYLSFEWAFSGDDNSNASVGIQYRPVGETNWVQGMPLRRVDAGSNATISGGAHWTTKYSGSLFKLNPGTNYEVQLDMNDPNGGSSQQTLNVSTRELPKMMQGNIIEFDPGFQGELMVESGTPGNPNIYRSKSFDDPAIFTQINLEGKHDVQIIGFDIQNLDSHGIKANGASDFVIARNTIHARHGIRMLSGATNGYVVDNVINGVSTWQESSVGASGNNIGEGIEVSGPGNVIAYNTVSSFRDNISLLEFEGNQSNNDQRSIDIHNNEITQSLDDAIEADFAQGNVRVIDNRITDAFIGISTQPTLGGPTYILRNSIYNVIHVPFKPNRQSDGDVIMHNTVVKSGSGLYTSTGDPFSNALFRNNLAIGGADVGQINGYNNGNSRPADVDKCDGSCSFDYDAVGQTAGSPNGARIYNPGSTDFLTAEPNGMILSGLNPTNLTSLFVPGVTVPTSKAAVLTEHEPLDLRLAAGAAVEGQALLIPGINDDFLGSGPDQGAYEAGQELPTYGQRALVPGDFNLDYSVTEDDLLLFQSSYGINSGGDADGDGDTDGHDFLLWQQYVASPGSLSALNSDSTAVTVPEPTSLVIGTLGGIALLFSRRRQEHIDSDSQ
ncbi:right-handed parallel beta-helix repeat-containing protein [Adhaeretor mobilis]|uniref:Uncharacterized protein n=1 Tax=Adhaeretor mobilis TaxID=1930276 RepID=A0A517N2X5_9BACT|nr:right-handed parallel beta-helix repeat-containing protein [Adhaeretor mobilis]QDT01486.1 hypothetical protein HG15A2_48280 [Adhaeretor mobilis]